MQAHSRKTIMIAGATGAAGNALAKALAAQNYNLVLLYRTSQHAGKLESQFSAYDKQCLIAQADLSQPEQVDAAIRAGLDRFEHIDVLINAAGGWMGGKKLHEHAPEALDEMLDMDLRPSFYLTRAILPVMASQKQGKIIHFGALSALANGANGAVYAASKTAVLKLVDAAAAEYRADGVQLFALAPGIIDTPNNRKFMPDADRRSWASLDEIIETVTFLIESQSALSGSVFKLGGRA